MPAALEVHPQAVLLKLADDGLGAHRRAGDVMDDAPDDQTGKLGHAVVVALADHPVAALEDLVGGLLGRALVVVVVAHIRRSLCCACSMTCTTERSALIFSDGPVPSSDSRSVSRSLQASTSASAWSSLSTMMKRP